MSKLMKPQNFIISPQLIYVNGLEQEKFHVKKLQEGIINMISHQTPLKQSVLKTVKSCPNLLSMQESVQKSKNPILFDNLNYLNLNIQNIPSLQISDQELTMKEEDSRIFWNNYSKEISKELWLPIKIDGLDSDLTSLNGYSRNLERYCSALIHQNQVQNRKLQKISWKLLPSLQQDIMEEEITKLVTKKIRIFPSKKQKNKFNQFFGTSRYFYNKSINEINLRYKNRYIELSNLGHCAYQKCKSTVVSGKLMCEKHINEKIPWKISISLQNIRKSIIRSNKELKGTDDEWQCETPYDTRQLSIKDAIVAYRSAVTNKIRGNIESFELKYKSKRNKSQMFNVDHRALQIKNSKVIIFPSIFNNHKLRVKPRDLKKLPKEISHDCKIYKDGQAYYLLIPVESDIKKINQPYDLIGNDQGIRTFTTTYSPDGLVMNFGEKQKDKIDKISKRIDNIKSTLNIKNVQNSKRRIRKLNKKSRDIVNDLHNHVCSIQTNNYKRIILPKFETSNMKRGSISKKTKRDMDLFGFYKFKEKMRLMCNNKGVKLYINCDERHTTKVCTNCLKINDVGSKKIINCIHCNIMIGRDINGARNIILKHLTY